MYMVQGIFCTCFYAGCVTRLKVSDRSPLLSTRKLCKTGISIKCFFLKKKNKNKNKNKKRGLRKVKKEKNTFWKTFSQIYFSFVWGLL